MKYIAAFLTLLLMTFMLLSCGPSEPKETETENTLESMIFPDGPIELPFVPFE